MNKNKIGIITYHNAINYGAVLQAYALNRYINNCGVSCETIDYHCKAIDSAYNLLKFNKSDPKLFLNSLIGLKNNIIKKIKFKKFKKENIKMSNCKYSVNNIAETNAKYNVFITGSDQVWRLDLNNDKNYYLDFVDSKRNSLNSYAASFGNINIIEKYSEYINKQLCKYHVITVREESAKEILKNKLNISSSQALDPTFLLSKEEWDNICKNKTNKEKYILVYILQEETAYSIAKKISDLTGLKIYVITQSYKKRINAKHIRNAGPTDFLTLIRNSEYVITDSFHGTALSIIYRKNLKVVLKRQYEHLNDRMISILNLFHLQNCITDINTPGELLKNNTDYSKLENIINQEISKSKEILSQIIY